MPQKVYDDEGTRNPITPDEPTERIPGRPSNDELRRITGISAREEQAMHDRAAGRGDASGSSARSREDLRNEETGSLYNPGGDDDTPEDKKRRTFLSVVGGSKRRLTVFFVSLVLGGGSAIGILGPASFPAKILHASSLLQGIHLDPPGDQADSRLYTLARNVRFFLQGTPERTRMGMLGNFAADRMTAKLSNSGVDIRYSPNTGLARVIVLNPAELKGGSFDRLESRTPAGVVDFLRSQLGIVGTTTGDGKVIVDPQQDGYTSRKNKALFRVAAINAGYRKLTGAIIGRIMGVRMGINWHPFNLKKRQAIDELEKRRAAFKKERAAQIRSGAQEVRAGADVKADEEGRTSADAEGTSKEMQELIAERDAAVRAAADGDPGALQRFRSSLSARLAGTSLAIVSVLCIIQLIAQNVDYEEKIKQIEPMVRIFGDLVARGDQIKIADLTEDDVMDLAFMTEYMVDEENNTEFFEASSLNAELGNGAVGKDIPDEARPGTDKNVVLKIVDYLPGLSEFCQASGTVAGGIVLFAVGALLGGALKELIYTGLFLTFGPKGIDWLVSLFLSEQVDVEARGAKMGNFANYGGRLAANDIGNSQGGLPMSEDDARLVTMETREGNLEEFQSKPLAYRLFESTDPRTLAGQIISKQKPTPAANIASTVTGFLNIGRSFGSMGPMLVKPLMPKAARATPISPYDYGFPSVGFTTAEMDSKRYEDPFANANRAADLLDGERGEEYVERARTCFGVGVVKRTYSDDIERWSIDKPARSASPLMKDILDNDNRCYGDGQTGDTIEEKRASGQGDTSWTDIRMFIFDTGVMNAYWCLEGPVQDEDTKQACTDTGIGNKSTPNIGAAARPGERSGLAWASGVHAHNPVIEDEKFGAWRGRPIDIINVFTDRRSWGGLITPFFLDQYIDFQSRGGMVDISQPLFPPRSGSYAACAGGAYNGQWASFGNTLANNGMDNPKTIVRLGWEFNLNKGYVGNKGNAPQFKQCFNNAAQAIKSTAPNVLIDWTLAGNSGDTALVEAFYPGDDYVDIVGVDWYDAYHPPITSREVFFELCRSAATQGPCYMGDFAREHNKLLGVGEWGATSCSGGTRTNDNPQYIEYMAEAFNEYKDVLYYEAYYDDTEQGNVCSSVWPDTLSWKRQPAQNPRASEAYLEAFGTNSPYALNAGAPLEL